LWVENADAGQVEPAGSEAREDVTEPRGGVRLLKPRRPKVAQNGVIARLVRLLQGKERRAD